MIKNIAFIPSYPDHFRNKIFNEPGFNKAYEPFNKLKKSLEKKSIEINTIDLISDIDNLDMVICLRYEFNLKTLFNIIRIKRDIKILVIGTEEICVAETQRKVFFECGLFDRVLTWRDNDVDEKIFHKYFYMNPIREYSNINKKKRLVCIINSFKKNNLKSKDNIYSYRYKLIDYFEGKEDFSLYGYNWENYKKNISSYKGIVDNKIEIYQKYKFAFAFENSNNEFGGISEKIFDIMASGCIPIYYGAPNISQLIPEKCFIDYRKFNSLEDLHSFLLKMSKSEILTRQLEMKKFLGSDKYDLFNSNGFTKNIIHHIYKLINASPNKKNIFKIRKNLFINSIKYKINPIINRKFIFGLFS